MTDPDSTPTTEQIAATFAAAQCSAAPAPTKEKTSGQCECCSSPLGDLIKLQGTKRIICLRCLGFLARWVIELEEQQNAKGQP